MFRRFWGRIAEWLGNVVDWQTCSEQWAFPVKRRPATDNRWQSSLREGQVIDYSFLHFPIDGSVKVSRMDSGFIVSSANTFYGPLIPAMYFEGQVINRAGKLYTVGKYKAPDVITAAICLWDILLLVVPIFGIPATLLDIYEPGSSWQELFVLLGTGLLFWLFIWVIAALLIFCAKLIGLHTALLNLPFKDKIKNFLSDISA